MPRTVVKRSTELSPSLRLFPLTAHQLPTSAHRPLEKVDYLFGDLARANQAQLQGEKKNLTQRTQHSRKVAEVCRRFRAIHKPEGRIIRFCLFNGIEKAQSSIIVKKEEQMVLPTQGTKSTPPKKKKKAEHLIQRGKGDG
jgi:hypothetical protein